MRRWMTRDLSIAGVGLAVLLGVGSRSGSEASESSDSKGKAFRYDAGNSRDPFVSLVRDGRLKAAAVGTQAVESSKPALYGILWDSGGRSLALINHEEVGVGDMVGGYRVREIRQDAVVMAADDGELFTLHITFESAAPAEAKQAATTDTEGERP